MINKRTHFFINLPIMRYIILGILTLPLSACQLFLTQSPKPIEQLPVEVPPPDDLIVSPPQLKKVINWQTILSPYLDQLLSESSSYEGNNTILISDIQNSSGNYLESQQIENTLHTLVDKQGRFRTLTPTMVNQAKQKVGISVDDKLVSRSKMVALAKLLNADYLLFTTLYAEPTESSDADLSVELIYTKTGEIINRISSESFANSKANE